MPSVVVLGYPYVSGTECQGSQRNRTHEPAVAGRGRRRGARRSFLISLRPTVRARGLPWLWDGSGHNNLVRSSSPESQATRRKPFFESSPCIRSTSALSLAVSRCWSARMCLPLSLCKSATLDEMIKRDNANMLSHQFCIAAMTFGSFASGQSGQRNATGWVPSMTIAFVS